MVETDAVPGRQWQGTVDYIYPVLDNVTRTARLRVVLENPDGSLLPNMFARLTIAMQDAMSRRLLVARDAVLRTGTMERVVLAVGEGRFKSVAVETGRRSREQVQIISGLEAGDEVVISAQFLIDSESSITSDFLRMSEAQKPPEEVWATGVSTKFTQTRASRRLPTNRYPNGTGRACRWSLSITNQLTSVVCRVVNRSAFACPRPKRATTGSMKSKCQTIKGSIR